MHINNGACPTCIKVRDAYEDFHPELWNWFASFQVANPDAHISCAGRGQAEQEADFKKGVSRAHWGQSAHNHNAALDVFRLLQTGASWDRGWFTNIMWPSVKAAGFSWGGSWKGSLGDFPHVEAPEWQSLPLVVEED